MRTASILPTNHIHAQGRYCTLSFVRTEQDWVKIGYFLLAVGGLFGLNGLIKQVCTCLSV